MTKEDAILNLIDGKDQIETAINKLTGVLCFLAQEESEDEDDRRNLSNIAFGIEQLKEIAYSIAHLS